jgi:hypothetical protein
MLMLKDKYKEDMVSGRIERLSLAYLHSVLGLGARANMEGHASRDKVEDLDCFILLGWKGLFWQHLYYFTGGSMGQAPIIPLDDSPILAPLHRSTN